MDWYYNLPAEFQAFAGPVFAIIVAAGGAFTYLRSRRQGPERPKVQEFYAGGELADMGPVKELVEQVGLLVQQQLRTAVAMEKAAAAYANHLAAEATQEAIEDRAQALFERRLALQREGEAETPPRRRPPST